MENHKPLYFRNYFLFIPTAVNYYSYIRYEKDVFFIKPMKLYLAAVVFLIHIMYGNVYLCCEFDKALPLDIYVMCS